MLAVDAEWDPVEGPDRPDESPGYHGQMRILGSLVWGDLFAMYASQSALLEDLWPLALDHPNTVYVGPVVPDEIKDWRLQNGLRNVCLQAVADYAHKKIDGTPFPVAPVQTNPTRAARSGTGDAGPPARQVMLLREQRRVKKTIRCGRTCCARFIGICKGTIITEKRRWSERCWLRLQIRRWIWSGCDNAWSRGGLILRRL